jgi:hypothetical protein
MTVLVTITIDLLFIGFCVYISTMYQSLSYDLLGLDQFYTNGVCKSQEDADDFKRKLKELIQDHVQIIKYEV